MYCKKILYRGEHTNTLTHTHTQSFGRKFVVVDFDVLIDVLPIWVRAEILQMSLKQLRSPRYRAWEGQVLMQGLMSPSRHQPRV